ncbi:hypothetical protein ES705_15218 [subsurface metagenome]
MMFREYSVSNELYSTTVNKLSAANRKIYRLKKELSQLKDSEVVASGEVKEIQSKFINFFMIGDKELVLSEFPGWLGLILRKYNGQEITISIRKGE